MTTKWLWPQELGTTIPSVLRTACHSNSLPCSRPLPLRRPCQQTLGRVPRATLLEAGSGLARGACGPRARNSPRRPAPQSPPRRRPARPRAPRPHPGREPPVESRNRSRAHPRARARTAGPWAHEGGKPPGFPEEGLGAWRRGGRCQQGVGAGPKQNWATHQEESSVRTR